MDTSQNRTYRDELTERRRIKELDSGLRSGGVDELYQFTGLGARTGFAQEERESRARQEQEAVALIEQAKAERARWRRAKFSEFLRSPENHLKKEYLRAREIFGDKFLGLEALKTTFTLKDGTELFLPTLPEFYLIEAQLATFLSESDINVFLEKLRDGTEPTAGWHLRYQPATLRLGNSLTNLQQIVPLTIKALQDYLEPDMVARGQGKLLHLSAEERDQLTDTLQNRETSSWYYDDHPVGEWVLGTDETVRAVRKDDFFRKSYGLNEPFAEMKQLDYDTLTSSCRAPHETLLTYAMLLRTRGQHILQSSHDVFKTDLPEHPGSTIKRCLFTGNFGANGGSCEVMNAIKDNELAGQSFNRRSGPASLDVRQS